MQSQRGRAGLEKKHTGNGGDQYRSQSDGVSADMKIKDALNRAHLCFSRGVNESEIEPKGDDDQRQPAKPIQPT